LRFYTGNNGSLSSYYDYTYTWQLNEWTHIAVTRESGTLRAFVNGALLGSNSSVTQSLSNSSAVVIGDNGDGGLQDFTGYISNLRIVKGTAVYTAAFTPSTTPLTAISGTSLLACQSNRFIDNSSNAFAITVNGNTSIQAFSPFNPTAAWSAATNGASGYFDGTGDYLSLAGDNAFVCTGDFTLETWVYADLSQLFTIANQYNGTNTNTHFSMSITTTGATSILLEGGNPTARITAAAGTFTSNTWHHFALVRQGSTVTLYRDGVSVGTTTKTTDFGVNNLPFQIGRSTTLYAKGYMADFRLVNGTAVYTSAFTPPTAPLTAITNTSLLLNYTNGAIYDATAKNDLETVGNAQISTTQSQWGGSSMYFDGTGDRVILPEIPLFNFGTEDFTIEAWIYVNDISAIRGIFGQNSGTAATNQFMMLVHTTGRLDFYVYYSSTYLLLQSATSAVSTGAWHHVAGVRNGSNFSLYLNGASVASTTAAITVNNSVTPLGIGAVNGQVGTYPMNGYIQDVRFTKGIARYTTGFTPPTAAFPLT